ncbi:CCR4-NOT core ubiquitin-protein ligase subunit MOT2 [Saccharomyces cerevisiae]|nr:CCR4-NOT core ubiquitin-protein ligase subunit MOT2 [Saccharomyces cerevisiae]
MMNPHVQENLQAIHNALSNFDTSFLSEDEEDYCPLCIEPMDITDKNFFPCPCGYQICQFCYNNIRQNPELNGRCPACRRKYDDENVRYVTLSPEELKMERAKLARKEKERKHREKERKENEYTNRKHLSGTRVIQKNLVYVVGINPPVPYEEVAPTLKSEKYFGQYGKINKIVVNRKTPHSNNTTSEHYHHHSPGYGVYITFGSKDDAARCIAQVDGTYMDGRLIKAAYGTTKYCSSYLRGLPCPNPNCMFLHEPGEEADSFNKRELHNKQQAQQQSGGTAFTRSGIHNNISTSTAGSNTNLLSENFTGTPSPAAMRAQLHHDSHTNAGTPVLTPAPVPAGSNPWGVTQSATPVASINLSKNSSSINLPTLNDSLGHHTTPTTENTITSTTTTTNTNATGHSHGSKKKQSLAAEEYKDPYDALGNAVDFLDARLHSLSNYQKRPISIKSNIIDEETYKKYPSLFSWDKIEASKKSDNTLANKLVEILAIKPIDYTASVVQFLQSVNVGVNDNITITDNTKTPTQPIRLQTVSQQIQPPLNVSTPPPGIFGPQHKVPIQQQQMGDTSSRNSSDLLNQLINGRKIIAGN